MQVVPFRDVLEGDYAVMGYDRRKALKKQRQLRRRMVSEYKLEAGCAICGYNSYHGALELHHKNAGDKLDNVARLVNGTASIKRIFAEIEKCEVLCANCHREVQAGLVER